jgi:hypothetical protein
MSTEPTRAEVEEFWADDVDRQPLPSDPAYRLWVNLDRTVLVRLWATGLLEVCTRDQDGATWGPPTELEEEKV